MKPSPVLEWASKQPSPRLADEQRAGEFGLVSNAFAFKLYSSVSEPGKNQMISPVSVSLVLALMANGAKGETQKLILRSLSVSGGPEPLNDAAHDLMVSLHSGKNSPVRVSNGAWMMTPIKPDPAFASIVADKFGGSVAAVDVASGADQVNKWVDQATSGMIYKVLDRLSPDDVVVLVNATAFIASWAKQFDPANTVAGTFSVDEDRKVDAKFMTMKKASLPYSETDAAKCVSLPYENIDYSMILILPKSGTPEEFLTEQTWSSWGELMGSLSDADVDVEIPKVRFRNHFDLERPFKKLGLAGLFSGDFSGFSPDVKGASLSRILHDTFVEMDEKGTRAAGTTTAVFTRSVRIRAAFKADRPFAFAIVHEPTDSILFLGVCNDPTQP